MTAAELIADLRHLGVRLWVDGEDLRYDAPAGVLSGARRDALRRLKADVIALLGHGREAGDARYAPIVRVPPDRPLPLSFAQRRVWFMSQLRPDSAFYNIPVNLSIEGPLDEVALRRSLEALVRRHESLRTTYRNDGGELSQIVHAAQPLRLESVDLGALRAEARDAEARRRAAEEGARLFDLGTGPLIRGLLIRLEERRYVLVLTVHHIAIDGWSLPILLRDLSALYEAATTGRPAELPNLSARYADFAAWQRQTLTDEALAASLAYWHERLVDAPRTELPTDRPRPVVLSGRGASVSIALDEEPSDALRTLARTHRVTLFTVLLAAYQHLLSRYTGAENVVTGVPTANRSHAEVENLIGFFVNSLVIRTDLSGDLTFVELLERVRIGLAGAFAHEDLPFERLVHELADGADLSRNPLFQTMFTLHGGEIEPRRVGDLSLALQWTETCVARFDVEIHAFDDGTRIWFTAIYDTDLYEAETIRRMLECYERLVGAVVADPERPVSELSLLDATERRQMLVGWNATQSPYPRDATVHGLFCAQASRTPDAVAVVYGEARMSYRELDERSSRLAQELAALGVGHATPVGLLVERSLELVVGMVGILKAGGAYVPLDPEDPAARLEFMLRDTGARVVLTQGPLSGRLSGYGGRVLCVGEGRDVPELVEREPEGGAGASAESLAYVLYTSGSTGVPKGVAVPHRAVVRLVRGSDYLQLGEGDVVAQGASASFDAATFEVWGALLNGARLELVSREVTLSPQRYGTFLRERGVTVLFMTTALFNQMVREVRGCFAGVGTVLFGGEAVDVGAVRRALAEGCQGRLVHVYGPTESTTFASWYEVGEVREGALTVPIGRPISNTRLYVLDERRFPVPVGVPGELYIGGDGLARGYWDRAELTAQRFVDVELEGVGVERLYRTGDRVRRRGDGAVEFLGRFDDQVKLRGFRIELGELEAVLRGHPGVEDAMVLCREDAPGDKRLVAYLTRVGEGPTVGQMREHLRAVLPEYMVPSAYVFLPALPLTSNGKVDRAALPAPDRDAAAEVAFTAPSGELESAIADIWSQMLGVEQVGIDDNFFDLGGNSMLLARVHERLTRSLGLQLSMMDLFRMSTVRKLVRHLDGGDTSARGVADARARARRQGAALKRRPAARDGVKT